MKVLIAGASGFIGTELSRQLSADDHEVLRLVRRAPDSPGEYAWSPYTRSVDPAAIEAADVVINLAGVPTGRIPWTPAYKREMLQSRVDGTRALAEAIAASANPPHTLLNGSAVGYYGHRPGMLLTEASAKGTGFLSDLVQAWEASTALVGPATRVVTFRTGLVIGNGGALAPLITLTRFGLGARLGSGRQVWPWISRYDEAAAIRHLMTSELSGAVNLAGPTAATAADVQAVLAETMKRWHPWIVPAFAIRMLGDAGSELLLASQRVSPQLLVDDGFEFRHPTIRDAIEAVRLR